MFKKMAGEFKQFIARGNVMDMAVGIIMGTAFTGIVNSLVQGVIMPVIGFFISGIDFADLKFVLMPAVGEAAEVAIAYGAFIQQILNFLIISFVVFSIVKLLNRLQIKKEAAAAAEPVELPPSAEALLLTEIRDLLQKNG